MARSTFDPNQMSEFVQSLSCILADAVYIIIHWTYKAVNLEITNSFRPWIISIDFVPLVMPHNCFRCVSISSTYLGEKVGPLTVGWLV